MARLSLVVAVLVALFSGVAASADPPAKSGLRVVVSIPPLAGLVRSLLPEDAKVEVLAPPGHSEHGFELTPGKALAIAEADLVVLIGMGMEPQVEQTLETARIATRRSSAAEHATDSDPAIVRFSEAVGEPHAEAEEGPHDCHDHAHGVDPHVWLDPMLCGKFVAAVSDEILALRSKRGEMGANEVAQHKAARHRALDAVMGVHAEYTERLAPFKGAAIVTHHNAFGRLAERYGLRIAATLHSGEHAEPLPDSVAEVARLARAGTIHAIFIEPQSDGGVARRIAAAAGIRTLVLDPLGDGDWDKMMRANLDALVEGLSPADQQSAPGQKKE